MTKLPRLLIVDDEPEIGRLLEMFFEQDFSVVTFTDPREAQIAISAEIYDLILTDIRMPHLTGLDLLRQVKNMPGNVPVVLMTGHAQTDADRAMARVLGAEAVLTKPFGDPDILVNLLKEILCKGRSAGGGGPPESVLPNVLVVDDDPDILKIVCMLIGGAYDVKAFADPFEALNLCKTHRFECVLTDLTMPKISGSEFVRLLRSSMPNTPIVIMSGYTRNDQPVIDAFSAGANDILVKPFTGNDAITNILKKYTSTV